MTAAGGLALILIGAALKYAITWQPPWVDLGILGTILVCGGLAAFALGAARALLRRREQRRITFAPHAYGVDTLHAAHLADAPGYDTPAYGGGTTVRTGPGGSDGPQAEAGAQAQAQAQGPDAPDEPERLR